MRVIRLYPPGEGQIFIYALEVEGEATFIQRRLPAQRSQR
jgi:hypothetical protein